MFNKVSIGQVRNETQQSYILDLYSDWPSCRLWRMCTNTSLGEAVVLVFMGKNFVYQRSSCIQHSNSGLQLTLTWFSSCLNVKLSNPPKQNSQSPSLGGILYQDDLTGRKWAGQSGALFPSQAQSARQFITSLSHAARLNISFSTKKDVWAWC